MTSPALTRQQIEEWKATAFLAAHVMINGEEAVRDYVRLCDLALSALSEPKGWVSVSERLPERETWVLVHNGEWTGVGTYRYADDESECWQSETTEFIEHLGPKVTHWQPLPAPPAPNAARQEPDSASVGAGDLSVTTPDAADSRSRLRRVAVQKGEPPPTFGSRSSAGKGEERQMADILHTMYHHSHHADGTERTEHCCGCWQIRYDRTGLFAFCNECTERRDINEEMTALVAQSKETP